MITVNTESENPLYEQTYEQIKNKIVIGDYPEGYQLTYSFGIEKWRTLQL
jgi:DNA-binding transcriptional regulator YhcF (GntR family)